MKIFQNVLAFFILFSALMQTNAFAHHGWRGYTVEFVMSAMVIEAKFGNPHDQIWVKDTKGQMWNFLLAPPAQNRRFGYDQTVIDVGDTVELIGQHSKTINEGKVHLINNAAGETIYTYYYESGQTSQERLGQ